MLFRSSEDSTNGARRNVHAHAGGGVDLAEPIVVEAGERWIAAPMEDHS